MVQERYERLVALQNEISWAENQRLVGREVELLVALGEGRKDADTHRMTGRARDGRLVHFTPTGPAVDRGIRPGDVVTATVTDAAPMFVCSPIVASPTYVRCGTFAPSPIWEFLTSTNAPILPSAPRSAPGRRNANGPTSAPSPTTAPEPCVRVTVAPSPTTTSRSVVSGPTVAPAPTRVAPCSCVPGSTVTS